MPSKNENKAFTFNEIMVSLYLYTLLHLTDFFGENEYRVEAGYVLISIILASVFVNLAKFFILISIDIAKILRKRKRQKL
jgi:hypothetical protein